jgi:hypothetical protein
LVFPAAVASAATPPSVTIGATGGVIAGGAGAFVSVSYRCSTQSFLNVSVTQATSSGGVAQAFGFIQLVCNRAKHDTRLLTTTQSSYPLHTGAAAVQWLTPEGVNVHRIVTLSKASFSTPGVVTSARRLGGGAVMRVRIPVAGCPAGGFAIALVTFSQRVGQQILTGQSANFPREGPPSVPCDQASPILPLAVIASVHPWTVQPALVSVDLQLCNADFTCTGATKSTVVHPSDPGSTT